MADGTLAKMFWDRVERSADKPAQQFKQGGQWQTVTWRQVGETVRDVATGLIALGRKKGEAVGILSASRAEWVQADFAIFSVGGITVPIYPSYTAEQVAYIVNDAEARLLVVEDASQLAKVLEVRGRMAGLGRIVVIEGHEGQDPTRLGWEALRQLGRDGLVVLSPGRGARLSARGRRMALQIVRRHRVLESFLVRILGLDWSVVHEDAEVLEHHISERVLEAIDRVSGRPHEDPHGHPIPDRHGRLRSRHLRPLASLAGSAPATGAGAGRPARMRSYSANTLPSIVRRVSLLSG